MPRYTAAGPKSAPSRGAGPANTARGVGSSSRGPSKAALLKGEGHGIVDLMPGQAAPTHEHLSRVRVAEDIGVPTVPFAQRVDVGFERDPQKYAPPEADFVCFGWMTKKGGIRKNWLERYFELDSQGMLHYYTESNEKPVKTGGSTKMQMCGYDEKGVVELKNAEAIRMSTAPNAEPGEIEILTNERTFRMVPGRNSPGKSPISDKVKAGQTWCLCMNLARIAAADEASDEMVAAAQEAAAVWASLA